VAGRATPGNTIAYVSDRLNQGCPTGSPSTGCGPQPSFIWPSKA